MLVPPPHLIPRNPEQISRYHSQRRIKTAATMNQGHEDLLRHVFRDRWAPAHMQCEAEDGTLPSAVQQHKGVLVTGDASPQQIVVSLFSGPSHLLY